MQKFKPSKLKFTKPNRQGIRYNLATADTNARTFRIWTVIRAGYTGYEVDEKIGSRWVRCVGVVASDGHRRRGLANDGSATTLTSAVRVASEEDDMRRIFRPKKRRAKSLHTTC